MYKANKFYINGEWVSPSTNEECEVINPATEEVIGSVAMGSEVDVNKAVAAAKAAAFAAATALFTSTSLPIATLPITSSVAGLITSHSSLVDGETHSPFM